MKKEQGVTLFEILIALLLVAILFFPMIELLNSAFMAEYENRVNVEAKEFREVALSRVSATLKEASYLYPNTITIPTASGSAEITPGDNAVVALIPQYDENGDIIQSAGDTEFDVYAYALMPANEYDSSQTSTNMVLIEVYDNYNCTASVSDKSQPAGTCTEDLSGSASSNVIFTGAKPATFSDYTSTFNIDGTSHIEVVFGAKEGNIYYPSTSGSGPSIASKFVQSVDIFCRNVPY